MSEATKDETAAPRHTARALRLSLYCATAAVVLAVILLVRTTDYMFVFFMFVGAPLVAVAAIALGWVILQDLRHKKVL